MAKEIDMDIDYEKLRKKLVTREFITAFFIPSHAKFGNCVNANDATPEELITIARRYNINLDNFKTTK